MHARKDVAAAFKRKKDGNATDPQWLYDTSATETNDQSDKSSNEIDITINLSEFDDMEENDSKPFPHTAITNIKEKKYKKFYWQW